MTRIIRSTPAETPPAKSPLLNFGVMIFVDDALGGDVGQRAFEAVADLDAQLAIVLGDHQHRTVVDLLAADLPGFRDPDRDIARWLSGSVVGTISTAIWLPLRASKSFSVCVSEAMSSLDSVPV